MQGRKKIEGYHLPSHLAQTFRPTCDGYTIRINSFNQNETTSMSFMGNSEVNITSQLSEEFLKSIPSITVTETAAELNRNVGMFDGELSHVVLYSFVFLIAVIGNFLVIATLLANKRMRTVTTCFLLSLSLSDLLLALICMPVSLTGRVLKRFVFGTIMCKALPYFMGISVTVSTFTMLAISVERYYAICRPLKSIGWQTKSHAYKVIIAVWIVSGIINIPFAVLSKLQFIPLIEKSKCSLACRLDFPSSSLRQAWYLFQLVALVGIPGISMSISYSMVSKKIWSQFKVKSNSSSTISGQNEMEDEEDAGDGIYLPKRKKKNLSRLRSSLRYFKHGSNGEETKRFTHRTSATSELSSSTNTSSIKYSMAKVQLNNAITASIANKKQSRTFSMDDSRIHNATANLEAKKRVVKMLIIIVILFFVCWTPLIIVNVWKAFDPQTAMQALDGVIEIIQLMSYISTCVNPIVYCFMNKRFRDGFLKAFLCCIPRCCVNLLMKIPVVGSTAYQ